MYVWKGHCRADDNLWSIGKATAHLRYTDVEPALYLMGTVDLVNFLFLTIKQRANVNKSVYPFSSLFFRLKVNSTVLSLHANSLSLGQNLLSVPAGWKSSKMSSANLKNVNIQLSTNLCNYHSQLCYPQVKLARLWGWLHWWMQEGLTGWLCCWP